MGGCGLEGCELGGCRLGGGGLGGCLRVRRHHGGFEACTLRVEGRRDACVPAHRCVSVQVSGFRVQGSGCRVQLSGVGV